MRRLSVLVLASGIVLPGVSEAQDDLATALHYAQGVFESRNRCEGDLAKLKTQIDALRQRIQELEKSTSHPKGEAK